jgi:hypothetical protein
MTSNIRHCVFHSIANISSSTVNSVTMILDLIIKMVLYKIIRCKNKMRLKFGTLIIIHF